MGTSARQIVVGSRDSLLTTSSGYTNYRGILNLVIILLVLSNARAALENILKYGILVDPLSWILFLCQGYKHWPALLISGNLLLHALVSLLVEKAIARLEEAEGSRPAEPAGLALRLLARAALVANLAACIMLPPIIIYACDTHPISTSASLILVSCVFFKLVSYHMMNFWCRDVRLAEGQQSRSTRAFMHSYVPPAVDFGLVKLEAPESPPTNGKGNGSGNGNGNGELRRRTPATAAATRHGQPDAHDEPRQGTVRREALKQLAIYPANLTLRDLAAFLLYPTLNYELAFARTERLRKRFLVKRIVELVILSQLDMALVQQWIVPTVSNSVLPFRQMQYSHMLERLLKLAVPNHVIWLIWFYLFFHSLLNIQAELTRYADREFYRDWWNSESVSYFWSNWNIPVHKWCARHLYVPLIALGLTKCQASTAVFFVSAFFHEYLVSVPLKMFRLWAFTGMLIQLPWARFVSSYFNSYAANVAVWVSLIIGQPLCILMYYHDYYVINHVQSLPAR